MKFFIWPFEDTRHCAGISFSYERNLRAGSDKIIQTLRCDDDQRRDKHRRFD